jgi:hypothetical protein
MTTDRRDIALRQTLAASLFLFGVALMVAHCLQGCTKLSPEAKAQIAKDQIELSVCAYDAHACKLDDAGPARCWAVFDACMVRHGFYDGGTDAR